MAENIRVDNSIITSISPTPLLPHSPTPLLPHSPTPPLHHSPTPNNSNVGRSHVESD
ncbi:MAG: hypothetical protein SWX82_18700 [Cyanobacteriota bacterium]|nr:hypothetical protein [Cyanobacteriota bacterium]